MMESLRQRAWGRLTVIFPERQIYIRSDGRVQFFAFTSQMQTILAAGGLLFRMGRARNGRTQKAEVTFTARLDTRDSASG